MRIVRPAHASTSGAEKALVTLQLENLARRADRNQAGTVVLRLRLGTAGGGASGGRRHLVHERLRS